MENDKKIISDLINLVAIANDGKAGYESASEATKTIELQGTFLKYSAQRAGYAMELKEHIELHGGKSENEDGGVLGALHRTWIDIKQALSNQEDVAILAAIETAEKSAIAKYDLYIKDYDQHQDHLVLLQRQRDGIIAALSEIQGMLVQREGQ